MRSTFWQTNLGSTRLLYLSLILLSLVWLVMERFEVLDRLNDLSVDARFLARGNLSVPVKLIYVDIDNAAIAELGNFPWDRGIFAKVCDVLITHGGVKAVGIDVVFSMAGVPNVADLNKVHSGHAELGNYLLTNPPVAIAATYAGGTQRSLDGQTVRRTLPRPGQSTNRDSPELPEWPVGPITLTPPIVGLIDTVDGDTRQVWLYAPAEERNYFQLSLELARLHFGLRPEDIHVFDDRIELRRESGELVQSIPMHDGQKLDVNWFSPWIDETNPRISIATIYQLALAARSDDPATRAAVTEWFSDGGFTDGIVLIGPVDALLQDVAPTPFDAHPVPKVGVHGNLLKTIVAGRFLKFPPDWTLPIFTFGLAALVSGLSLAAEGRRGMLLRLIGGLVLVGYIAVCFGLFAWGDWLLPMVAPLGAALSAAFVGGAGQLVLAQQQKSRIKGLFGAYLSPAVVSQMVDSGQEPKLGGVEEEITAYFSDVQSFSTVSEALSATQLVELMNEYLTACTDIVQAEGGTLDKYIGDALVAIYGAPLALPGHAHRAAVAALRVERRCEELREKWRHDQLAKGWPDIVTQLRTRTGLSTGKAVVGNMGSASRFNYTMMGDTVNLAARMESGAKSWGVYNMCSETTRFEAMKTDPERIVFRSLGRVVVKGRTVPISIYELVGLKEDVTDRTREAIAIFEEGLNRYRMQDWEGALECFRKSAVLEPKQPGRDPSLMSNPSLIYQHLVAEARANPPGASWDGAYVMREK